MWIYLREKMRLCVFFVMKLIPLPRHRRRFELAFLSAAMFGIAWTAAVSSRAAEIGDALIQFDIPAGSAERSLKEFSVQSGAEVLFVTDAVASETCREVHGALSSREALDRMLAGTRLVETQDKKTGAFRVLRADPAGSDSADPKTETTPVSSRADSPSDDDSPVKLNQLVVTGSYIPTAADATAAPVLVLGLKDMESTGVNADLLEMLRKRVPSFIGSRGSLGNSSTDNFLGGGSEIALRGLDTLVLVNGRRVAANGVNAAGGKNFVDINMIGMAAIDHVEILSDGASAIYGSDAVGGVVNIILKSNYHGAEIGGRYAVASNGGNYTERSGYIVAGGGTSSANLTVAASYSKTSPLFQKDRPFISTNIKNGSNFPGFVSGNQLAPGLASPSQTNPTGTNATAPNIAALIANGTYVAGNATNKVFNAAPYLSLLIGQEQRCVVLNGSAQLIGKKLEIFGDFLYAHTKSSSSGPGTFGNLVTLTVPAGSPYNPVAGAVPGVVVGSSIDTSQNNSNETRGARVAGGLRGEINSDWNWEVGYVYNENRVTENLKNEIFGPNLDAAIAGGYDASGKAVAGGRYSKVLSGFSPFGATVLQPALDPFARSGRNPASLANVYGTEVIQTKGTLESIDAKVVGSPFALPAGKLELAVGGAARREAISGVPDQNSLNLTANAYQHNWVPGTFLDPFSHSRTIKAYFGEVRIPVTSPTWSFPGLHTLDLSVAVRKETYNDVGGSTVPKVGIRWQPIDDQFTVRFTYSKAFTAPALAYLYSPPAGDLTTADDFYQALPAYNDPRLLGLTWFDGNGNNPDLKPSTAISRSIGFVFSPKAIEHLTLSMEYINVFQKGLPGGIGTGGIIQSVDALGSASPFFSAIYVGGLPGRPGSTQAPLARPGGLHDYVVSPTYANDVYVLDHFVNLGGVHEQAVDINVDYEIPTASAGTFSLSTTGTYLKSFSLQAKPSVGFYELAGYVNVNGGTAGSYSKYSFYTTLDWKHRNFGATLANTYLSSLVDIPGRNIPVVYLQTHAPTRVSYYTAWDLQFTYVLDQQFARGLWKYFKGMQVTVGVNNLFNRMPPYAGLSNSPGSNYDNVDASGHSPIGRLFFISDSLKF